MNSNEVKNMEIIITAEDLLNNEIICEKKYLTKEQLEEQLLLLIIYKMCYEQSLTLPIKIEDVQKYGTKLHELFKKLNLPCNHFRKIPNLEIYDELKIYLIKTVYENKYGTVNSDLSSISLKIDKYTILSNLKKYKELAKVVDIGYRLVTDKPLLDENEKDKKEIYIKEISTLVENIEMINLISSPNSNESISFLEYFDLFIEYQKYYKQKIRDILDEEYLYKVYTDIDISRYISDEKSTVLGIRFEENYGKSSRTSLFEKERIADKFRYICDKSKLITKERTLDKLFDFAERNSTYIDPRNSFSYPAQDEHLSVFIFPNNEDKYKNLGITYNDGIDIINIQSNYIDEKMNYELHINGVTIHILNEDIEPILENLYINIEFLPKYLQDYITYKNKKNKVKQKKIEEY